ncbi:MAG: hypothetical protein U9Q69_03330 [Nanoarchaeota archaeon]|nr:hypothetical protein [Nanoarchaeota archaeon]
MVFITFNEIVGMAAVSLIIGYILSGYIKKPKGPFEIYRNTWFDWDDVKFATIIAAPAVILHELGHKFVGMGFGLPAVFHAYWPGLGFGVILKLIGSPFLILAPAYVSFPATASPLQITFIALAGPLVNLMLWLGAALYLKYHKRKLSRNSLIALMITKKLNMFLFIFNMLPIPPLDGSKVFAGLIALL